MLLTQENQQTLLNHNLPLSQERELNDIISGDDVIMSNNSFSALINYICETYKQGYNVGEAEGYRNGYDDGYEDGEGYY